MAKFNRSQQQAINHNKGPVLVLAGPGSGKTTVIVNRTKTLIQKYNVNPENILVVTFTKTAAIEMAQRYIELMKNEIIPNDYDYRSTTFSTIHSLCLKILTTSFGYTFDQIISNGKKYEYIQDIVTAYNIETADMKQTVSQIIENIGYIKNTEAENHIKSIKNLNIDSSKMEKIFNDYQVWMKKHNYIDFEDMMILAYQHLTEEVKVLRKWQRKIQYIMIDEFQDTNKIQAKVLYLLAKPERNIMIVGDDDQSLYGFRGADPSLMLEFPEEFNGCKKILLDTNYRCSGNIVKASLELIQNNKIRFNKDIKSHNAMFNNIDFKIWEDEKIEAKKICKLIQNYNKKGIPYEDMAVIYRINRQSSTLIQVMSKMKIDFQSRKEDLDNIYDHWIFRDILRIYQISRDLSSASWEDIKDSLKRPSRYIPNNAFKVCKSLKDLRNWGYDNKKIYISTNIMDYKDEMEYMNTLTYLPDLLSHIEIGYKYKNGLKKYAEFNKLNTEELLDIFDELIESGKHFSTMEEWLKSIDEYNKSIKYAQDKNEQTGVTLTTMHSSKGREWKVVFVIDCNDKITPYKKAHSKEEKEEERRMFYVAMTRAKRYLHLYSTGCYHGKSMEVSPFIIESYKTNKSD